MANVILNRDLRASGVPAVAASHLALDGAHDRYWSGIWRFARSFDLDRYDEDRGQPVDLGGVLAEARSRWQSGTLSSPPLTDLRIALQTLYWEHGRVVTEIDDARLVDALLDATYAHVSGGGDERRNAPDPPIGTFAEGPPGRDPPPTQRSAITSITLTVNGIPSNKARDLVKVAVLPAQRPQHRGDHGCHIRAEGGLAGIPRETLELVVLEGLRQLGLTDVQVKESG